MKLADTTRQILTDLSAGEHQLFEEFRRLRPDQQPILWNALRHLASGVPGARLTLSVER